jgi:hypothetical protein
MTAVANRYLSVLKNAAIVDLITLNLPLIIAHCLGRIVVTPRLGIRLTALVLSNAPGALRRRRPGTQTRHDMHLWFRWSAQQPTMQRSLLSTIIRRVAPGLRADHGFIG